MGAVVALVVAVAPNLWLRALVVDAHDQLDDARGSETEAAERDLAYGTMLAAFGRHGDDVAVATRASTDATARSETTRAGIAAEAAALRDQLGRNDAARAATEARIQSFQARIAATSGQIADLRACVDGVAAAMRASTGGNTAGAVAAMQTVAGACQRARTALGDIDANVRFPYDFPDPYVLTAGGSYYGYATNSAGGAVQLIRSSDLVTWSFAGTALGSVPSWAQPGATWAPSVLARAGRWVLYYAVRDRASGIQCISAATASSPTGPFTDTSSGPLVCDLDNGGSIDPSPFVAADGTAYLVWKSEGETVGGRATLRSQSLAADGLSVTGTPNTLLQTDQAWEGRTIEGPSMIATNGGLVLLYSANRWNSSSYGIGAAFCDSPRGPCRKVAGPVLGTTGAMTGPGGAEAFVDGAGTVRVAFHAWQGSAIGHPNNRYLHIGELRVSAGAVSIVL